MKMQWCIYNIALPNAILVTIVFWSVLYPMNPKMTIDFYQVGLHACNCILIFTEQYLGAIPTRLLHVYQPMIYALTYGVFSVIFWSQTQIIFYQFVLDWKRPGPTTASLCGILIYFCIAQLVLFLIYRLQRKSCSNVHDD